MTGQGKEKKDRPTFAEAAQGLTTPILSYVGEKSSIKSVLPDSIYHFRKLSCHDHVYILENIELEQVEGFPSIYHIGENKGRGYITYRKTVSMHLKGRFPYTLELENARMFTGLKMKQGKDGIYRGYGDDKNMKRRDCVLVAVSPDQQSLDIAFIFGRADKAKEVYQAWLDDVERVQNELYR